jgi:hypothetical protein
MPKTNFVDGNPSQGILGTVVPADFLNALNKHYHTGLDEDGHGALPYAADTGTANAYVVNLNPDLAQYVSGMPVFFKAANNNTGTSTIDINGLGSKMIKKNISQDLAAGDIQAGQIVMVLYDGVNFQFIGGLDAHAVDGYHASVIPAANNLAVSGADGKLDMGWLKASETPTANQLIILDTNGKLPLSAGSSFIGALVGKTAHQSIATGTFTKITWDAESYDTSNIHDNAINNTRMTVPAGVTYVKVKTQLWWQGPASASGYKSIVIRKNGSYFEGMGSTVWAATTIADHYTAETTVVPVTAGDYFEVEVYQNTGVTLTLYAGGTSKQETWFALEAIR